jgi:CheY-like chemotaxis protein
MLCNCDQNARDNACIHERMSTNGTLLCIHRNPDHLSLLQQNGYEVLTATTGGEGLRLFMSQPVDAIVLDYQLGLLDGGIVAAEIKKVKPQLPIVMLAEHLELPDHALRCVDAIVSKSDTHRSLLPTVRSILNADVGKLSQRKLSSHEPRPLDGPGKSREETEHLKINSVPSSDDAAIPLNDAPFSPGVWRNIQDGTFRF